MLKITKCLLFKIIETQNPRSTMEGSQKLTNKLFCKNLVTPMNFFKKYIF